MEETYLIDNMPGSSAAPLSFLIASGCATLVLASLLGYVLMGSKRYVNVAVMVEIALLLFFILLES
jgi:hypothetical protein